MKRSLELVWLVSLLCMWMVRSLSALQFSWPFFHRGLQQPPLIMTVDNNVNTAFAENVGVGVGVTVGTVVRFSEHTPVEEIHVYFMNLALQQAAAAGTRSEVPIGAVVVRNQTQTLLSQSQSQLSHLPHQQDQEQHVYFQVLSVAGNAVEERHDASAHAELLALRAAANREQNWRLSNQTILYSTLEPCPMCLAAAQAFRIEQVVYGAPDLRLGAVETHMRLLQDHVHPFHNITRVVSGVQAEQSAEQLRAFFRQRRLEQKQRQRNGGGGGGQAASMTQQPQQQERRHWLSLRRLLRGRRQRGQGRGQTKE
jgi:tRNA(adenine34) deaminase